MFGDVVRGHRRRLGLTQDELAERSGLSVRSIGKIEARQVEAPRSATVRLLADAFGLTDDERERFVALAVNDSTNDPDDGPVPDSAGPVPRQLPAAVTRLVGRAAEWETLVTALNRSDASTTPTVVAVHGPGGVGKSALAVSAAHAVASSFPDGQLYVDLQGSTPAMVPLAVVDVAGRFLRALGVNPAQIPVGEAEALSLYRTVVAGKRILVVADNAGTAEQVSALLPTTAGSALIATSRQVLAMLDGAARVDLRPLCDVDARELLASMAGARAEAEPKALATVARACGNLPLALRIAGARLVSRPDWTVSDLARRLADERRTLREFHAADEMLRASLRLSWRELRAGGNPIDTLAARLFLALGAIRLPAVRPGLAAALCSTAEAVAELALDRLVQVRLADRVQGRYRMHDLLRLYAAELAVGEVERDELLRTALRWYVAGADQVGRAMRGRVYTAQFREQVDVLTEVSDAPSAGAWLDGERANIVALVRHALTETVETSTLAADLVLALYPAILMRGHGYEFEVLCRLVLDAADRVREPSILAYVWTRLGMMYAIQVRSDDALECAEQAITLHRLAGNPVGEASALEAAGMAYMRLDRVDAGLSSYEAALSLRLRIADRYPLGITLSNLAEAYHRSGRSEEALDCLERSLVIRREFADVAGEAITLLNLGEVYGDLGRDAKALSLVDAAIAASRRAGQRENERRSFELRARLRLRTGDIDPALRDCEHVLELAGNPDTPVDLSELIGALEAADQHEFAGRIRRRTARVPV